MKKYIKTKNGLMLNPKSIIKEKRDYKNLIIIFIILLSLNFQNTNAKIERQPQEKEEEKREETIIKNTEEIEVTNEKEYKLGNLVELVNQVIEERLQIQPKNDIEKIIIDAANRHGVNPQFMLRLAFHESGMNPTRESIADKYICQNSCNKGLPRQDGLCGSHGLFQILAVCHPDITYDQMIDPYFASEFTAKEISLGKEWKWSASKKVYAEGIYSNYK